MRAKPLLPYRVCMDSAVSWHESCYATASILRAMHKLFTFKDLQARGGRRPVSGSYRAG